MSKTTTHAQFVECGLFSGTGVWDGDNGHLGFVSVTSVLLKSPQSSFSTPHVALAC